MHASLPSSSSSSSCASSIPSPSCEVCGDIVHSKQYGVPACMGCIVFFRRAIQNKSEFKCWRNGKCAVTPESRCCCRCCRLTKCFKVGMNPEAILNRDQLGPRDPRKCVNPTAHSSTKSSTGSVTPIKEIKDPPLLNIECLIHLQQIQHSRHKSYSNQPVRRYHDVTSDDVNYIFKHGMKDAMEWANQFEPFRLLSSQDKKWVLSEYGIGFALVEQAFNTSREKKRDCWYLHSGAVLGCERERAEKDENENKIEGERNKNHHESVSNLIDSLCNPFKTLKVNELECTALKTLLLLVPSFPSRVAIKNCSEHIDELLSELMTSCIQKFPKNGVESEASSNDFDLNNLIVLNSAKNHDVVYINGY